MNAVLESQALLLDERRYAEAIHEANLIQDKEGRETGVSEIRKAAVAELAGRHLHEDRVLADRLRSSPKEQAENADKAKREQAEEAFAGDIIEAHQVGCEFVRQSAMQPVTAPFDVVVAGEDAIFSISETRWGLMAGIILPQLCQAMGLRRLMIGSRPQAREHLTTAETMFGEMEMRYWREQAETELTNLLH